MSKSYFAIALEQTQDDAMLAETAPVVDQVTADNEEAGLDSVITETNDINDDATNMAIAHENLLQLAYALESDPFQNHSATAAEVRSVKMALESYGLEDDSVTDVADKNEVKKDSLITKLKNGAVKFWEWIKNICIKIGKYAVEVYDKMARPMLTYGKRIAHVQSIASKEGEFKELDMEKFKNKFVIGGNVANKFDEFITFVYDLTNNTAVTLFSDITNQVKAFENNQKEENLIKLFKEACAKFETTYDKNKDSSVTAKEGEHIAGPFLGGWTFSLETKYDQDNFLFSHSSSSNTENAKAPDKISKENISDIAKKVIRAVGVWKISKEVTAKIKADKIVKELNNLEKSKEGISDFSKKILKEFPKLLNGPLINATVVLTKMTGNVVSFAEAHVGKTLGEKVSDLGSATKDKASELGSKAKDKANKAKDSVKGYFKKDN